jgi:acyl dehydratase
MMLHPRWVVTTKAALAKLENRRESGLAFRGDTESATFGCLDKRIADVAAASFEELVVGCQTTFTRTVDVADVELFAEVTGDNDPIHVDDAYAATTPYGKRIAQGALVVGYMMAASTQMTYGIPAGAASVGFDRIRHVAPVFCGDTLTVRYEIISRDEDRRRAVAGISVDNQDGETVAVANHILKVF